MVVIGLPGHRGRLREARAHGLAVDEHGAGAALALAAAVLGAGQVELVAQNAKQALRRVGLDAATTAVDQQLEGCHVPILAGCSARVLPEATGRRYEGPPSSNRTERKRKKRARS